MKHTFEGVMALSYPQRALMVCKFAAALGMLLAAAWMVAYMAFGYQRVAASILVLLLVCLPLCWMAHRGEVSNALIGAQLITMAFLVYFCLVFDIPKDGIPRATHLYFLPLALIGFACYRLFNQPLQLAVIAVSLATFLFLDHSELHFLGCPTLPATFRAAAGWINSIAAILLAGVVVFFLQERPAHQVGIFDALLAALRGNQFELFFQPQVDQAGQIFGAEALIRWNHPKKGYLSPAQFLPISEQLGIGPRIGLWVLHKACETLVQWGREAATKDLVLAVNITADQFMQADFDRRVIETVAAHGIHPGRLKLELTESVFAKNIDQVRARMEALTAHGFLICLDDFGTGYSSLAYLQILPLKQLKVDRSFVRNACHSERDAALAKSIIQIGLSLQLRVLAEGVETAEELEFMRSNGCHEFQGYYFGRPMPNPQFMAHAQQQHARTSQTWPSATQPA